jgi:uncharacterized protein (TIGR02246 family)
MAMTHATAPLQDVNTATAAIEAIIQKHVQAWNTHNRQAFESLFTEDADFVNVIGQRAIGREQIGADFEYIHQRFMRNTQLKIRDWDARFVAASVAVVRIRWEMTGMEQVPGWKTPDVRHGLISYVVVERNGAWKVTAVQNTDIQDIPVPR